MPDRWASRCSTVTASSISGNVSPRISRAVVLEREGATLDERHHGECRERLGAARDADAGVGRHLDAMGTVGVPGHPLDDRRPVDIDARDAGERRLRDHGVERVAQFGRVVHVVDRTTRGAVGVVEVPAQPTQWRRAGGVVERELDPRPPRSRARLVAASRARRGAAAGDEVHRRAVRERRVRRRVRGARLRGRAPRPRPLERCRRAQPRRPGRRAARASRV